MTEEVKRQSEAPKWHELALGTAIIYPGSARACKTGDWTSIRPVWRYVGDATGCVQCGVCTIYCPEGCIFIRPLSETGYDLSRLKIRPECGLTSESLVPDSNLNYCKGCGICVYECPTHCIEMAAEEL
jgi:pyruvate ferredoxin oxidoreductase delta subunit